MAMSFREMNNRVFDGEPVPHVLFQPRMEPWYHWHRIFGQLPERYQASSVMGFYQDLDCSMRYIHYYTGVPDPVLLSFDAPICTTYNGGQRTTVYDTPHGELVRVDHWTVDHTWRTVGFPVASPDDLRALRWLFGQARYAFQEKHFLLGDAYLGDQGEPQFWLPKSPYQALAQQWMTLPNLIYALADDPDSVHDAMRAIDDAYDPLYEQVCASGQVRIINFGENIHQQLISPRYWEQYFMPFYAKRCEQLHEADIYSHVHIDGFFSDLMPYFADMPHDGIEALTPTPQGDVDLDVLAQYMGDKVLLDGLPAIYFMKQYPAELLYATAERLVRYFHPRLVLGISDELPQGAGPESLERVRYLARWARRTAS